MSILTKSCSLCKQTKDINEFGTAGTRRRSRCKDCYKAYTVKANEKRKWEMVTVECDRCGIQQRLYLETFEQRVNRGRGKRCDSCATKRTTMIRYGKDYCFPWAGDFDADDNPMKNGELYKPGVRLCGHKDCTNVRHIEAKL